MSQISHHDPGLPGATFETENVYARIVADGIHVDYHILSIAKKLMKEKLFLVTDAVEENQHEAYLHVRQKDHFTLPDGTLSGSMLTMLKAVRNCVEHDRIPLDEALRMASTYPAQLINAKDIGKIEPGFKANLVVFTYHYHVKYSVIEEDIFNDK